MQRLKFVRPVAFCARVGLPNLRAQGAQRLCTRPQASLTVATSNWAVAARNGTPLWRSMLPFQKVPSDNNGDSSFEGGDGDGKGHGGHGGYDGRSDGPEPDDNRGLFARLIAMYTRSVTRRPIFTKAMATMLIGLAGDYGAQRIAQRHEDNFVFDRRRSASIGIWGFCFMGPVLHHWYGALDRLFFGRFASLYKVSFDQLMFAPLFNSAFIAGIGTLEGEPFSTVGTSVAEKIWPTMKANWILWPAAQLVNFAMVPRAWQIIYVNCVGLVWNVILTYITHQGKGSHDHSSERSKTLVLISGSLAK